MNILLLFICDDLSCSLFNIRKKLFVLLKQKGFSRLFASLHCLMFARKLLLSQLLTLRSKEIAEKLRQSNNEIRYVERDFGQESRHEYPRRYP